MARDEVLAVRPKGLVVVDEEQIAQVMKETPEVIAAYLFGSAARGETDHFSDVDVAVFLEDDLPKERRWDIEGRLLDQLFRIVGQDKADVVDLKTAPLWFQRVVITTGRVIYERDRKKREAYERQVLQQQEADEGQRRKTEEMQLRLEVLERSLERLEQLAQLDYDAFMSDWRNLGAAERLLQTSIEALADISRHIVRRLGLRMPDEYWQIPQVLAEAGYLPAENVPTYEAMVRFRNRLVHRYPEIEPSEIYRIVTQELGEIRRWRDQIVQILQTLG